MKTHSDRTPGALQRTEIAVAAARLMAESGLKDFSLAKRKAAKALNLPASTPLPDNAEVEAELRTYQRLFQDEEQRERLKHLRRIALETMTRLERFNPWLAGAVLDGSAGRDSEIDIQLFPDSAKEVEIFLLNQGIEYEHDTPRNDRAEAVLVLYREDEDEEVAVINLVIYPPGVERIAFRTRDGRVKERAKLAAVRAMVAADEEEE